MKKAHNIFLKTNYRTSSGEEGKDQLWKNVKDSQVRLTKRTPVTNEIIEQKTYPFRTFNRTFLYEITRNLTEKEYTINDSAPNGSPIGELYSNDSGYCDNEITDETIIEKGYDNLKCRESTVPSAINDYIGIIIGGGVSSESPVTMKKLVTLIGNGSSAGELTYENSTKLFSEDNNTLTFRRRFQNYGDGVVTIREIGIQTIATEVIDGLFPSFLVARDAIDAFEVNPDEIVEIEYLITFYSSETSGSDESKTFTAQFIKYLRSKFEDPDTNDVTLNNFLGASVTVNFDNDNAVSKGIIAGAGESDRGIIVGTGSSVSPSDSSITQDTDVDYEDTNDSINNNLFFEEFEDGNSGYFEVSRKFVNRTAGSISLSQAGLVLRNNGDSHSFLIAKWFLKDDGTNIVLAPGQYLEINLSFIIPYVDL